MEVKPLNADPMILHTRGWVALNDLPKWEVFEMVEDYHAKHASRVEALLKSYEDKWHEIDPHGNNGSASRRPGKLKN